MPLEAVHRCRLVSTSTLAHNITCCRNFLCVVWVTFFYFIVSSYIYIYIFQAQLPFWKFMVYMRLIELCFHLVRFSLGSWPMWLSLCRCLACDNSNLFPLVGACSIVVLEFERSATTYFGSLRVELGCASLGMPNWVWSSMNRMPMFICSNPEATSKLHLKLNGRCCMPNNELPTTSHIEWLL